MSDVSPSSAPEEKDKNWSRRLVIAGVVVFGLVILAWIGAAFVPRWWAHRIGDQANESFSGGISLGLFYGFVFTLLPLLLIVWGIRKRRSPRAWLIIVAGALLLALPNLFTLGITLGRGNAAHAGDRTLDVDAPGFRGATLAGALVALAIVGFIWYLLESRHRAREELRRHKEAQAAPLDQAADTPVGDGNAQHADAEQRDRP